MTYKDYTIKARLKNFELIEKTLATMNSKYVGLDKQTDYYFDTSNGKLKLRQGTIENIITHYERIIENDIEKTIVYRYDRNPSIDAINDLRKNSKQIDIVSKERKIYTVDNIKIHLDTLPDGQCFIEIEAIDLTNSFTDDELRNQCLIMKSMLGIADSDLVRTGYMSQK